MIWYENGNPRYFDKNGIEIREGDTIKITHADLALERTYEVYRTETGELGTDATNPSWVASGRAAPCEYGIYPLTMEDTELAEVIR